MKFTLVCAMMLLSMRQIAQRMILHDPVSARVFSSEKYSGINGSPFLFDKWITGSVTVAKGVYNNLELKLDAYSNVVYFNQNDESHEFQDEVQSFVLMPRASDSATYMYFKKGIRGPGIRNDQFVEVLSEGPVNLYKAESKLVTDVNEINRGVIKTFSNTVKYFIIRNNQPQEIKLNKKDILEIVKDKDTDVQTYITGKKLSTKKESNLVAIVKYYNTL